MIESLQKIKDIHKGKTILVCGSGGSLLDIDISKVTFIFSFNDPSLINYILLDRITLIETLCLNLEH